MKLVGHFIAAINIYNKKIYDEVTDDMFDMSNLSIFNKEMF